VFLSIYVSAGAPDDPVYGLLSFLSIDAAVGYSIFGYWSLFKALSFPFSSPPLPSCFNLSLKNTKQIPETMVLQTMMRTLAPWALLC